MSLAFLAGADPAQMLERINAGIVAVAPIDLDGIVADLFDVQHLERGCEHLEGPGLGSGIFALLRGRAMRAGAGSTGTFVAQIAQLIPAVMAILPVDLNALGF